MSEPTVGRLRETVTASRAWHGRALALVLPVTTMAPALGVLGTPARVLVAATAGWAVLRAPARLRELQVGLLLGLVLLLSAEALGAPTLGHGLVRLLNWLMFVPLVFLRFDARVARLLGASLLLACWLQVVGVALQATGRLRGTWGGLLVSGSLFDPTNRTLLTRYTGFLGNPNDLGLLLCLGVVVALVGLVTREYGRRSVLLLSGACFTWVLFLTGSRGAIVGLVVGIAVVVVLLRPKHAVAVAVGGVAVGIVPVLTSDAVRRVVDSIGAIVAGRDASASFRSNLWAEQLRVNDRWLLGNGFSGYVEGSPGDGAVTGTVDNAWLKLLLEAGLVGCAVLALLLLAFLVPLLTTRRAATPFASTVAVVVSACLVMVVWRSLSADLLDINPWNAVLWILLGLAGGLARTARTPYHSLDVQGVVVPAQRLSTSLPVGGGIR
ncbi:O-antigen ligase family protein [Actinotalea ferrariae]|uniref:O-antigen ligase family protein n=1 Tax=Actinotalea ferrariae TaxID=1386098 RepID=UPI001C8C1C01|nr:O-antigen ligase family protein [Actinotalea ferrariae]MBX9244241.1 O-antigen ligase family protein [Actinotalea ferrariae]